MSRPGYEKYISSFMDSFEGINSEVEQFISKGGIKLSARYGLVYEISELTDYLQELLKDQLDDYLRKNSNFITNLFEKRKFIGIFLEKGDITKNFIFKAVMNKYKYIVIDKKQGAAFSHLESAKVWVGNALRHLGYDLRDLTIKGFKYD